MNLTPETDRAILFKALRDLSEAYLSLRRIIPGAFDTPIAPSPEDVWRVTEDAARRMLRENHNLRARLADTQELRECLKVIQDTLQAKRGPIEALLMDQRI